MHLEKVRALDNACETLARWKQKDGVKSQIPPVCAGANFEVKGEYERAKAKYKIAADVGDLEAMYRLGNLYEKEGKTSAAINLYKKAAQKGHTLSKWTLYSKDKYSIAESKEALISLAEAGFGPAMVGRGVGLALKGYIAEGKEMLMQAEKNHGFGSEHLSALTKCEKGFSDNSSIASCFEHAANEINKANLPGYIDPLAPHDII